jgi:hypothetical protein
MYQNSFSSRKRNHFNKILGENDSFQSKKILKLVTAQNGNYIIQKIISFGTEEQIDVIYDAINDNYKYVCSQPYARYVISHLRDYGYQF